MVVQEHTTALRRPAPALRAKATAVVPAAQIVARQVAVAVQVAQVAQELERTPQPLAEQQALVFHLPSQALQFFTQQAVQVTHTKLQVLQEVLAELRLAQTVPPVPVQAVAVAAAVLTKAHGKQLDTAALELSS